MTDTIKVRVGGAIGPSIKVKVLPSGIVEPTNPVIIGPTTYNNDVTAFIDQTEAYADNAAATAYSNSVIYTNTDLEEIDCGTFDD